MKTASTSGKSSWRRIVSSNVTFHEGAKSRANLSARMSLTYSLPLMICALKALTLIPATTSAVSTSALEILLYGNSERYTNGLQSKISGSDSSFSSEVFAASLDLLTADAGGASSVASVSTALRRASICTLASFPGLEAGSVSSASRDDGAAFPASCGQGSQTGQSTVGLGEAPVAAASHLHATTGGQSLFSFSTTVRTSVCGVFGHTGHCFSTYRTSPPFGHLGHRGPRISDPPTSLQSVPLAHWASHPTPMPPTSSPMMNPSEM